MVNDVLYIVVPCYNEQEVLPETNARLLALLSALVEARHVSPLSRVLYVDDGSTDGTWSIINTISHDHEQVTAVKLAANVGHQNALVAGLEAALPHAHIMVSIDADLQDDCEVIKLMVDRYESGCDIVYGVRRERKTDSWFKRNTAQAFYRTMAHLGVKTVYNHADFRLMSKRALDALAAYPERNLYLRGLIPTLGFNTATVDDVLSPRLAGESKYTLSKMLRLATDGITSFSTRPIELILYLGLFMMLIAIGMFFYVIVSLIIGHYTNGWASIMMSLWFIGAVITIAIGIVGIYIGRIYIESKHRPLYIVAERLTN